MLTRNLSDLSKVLGDRAKPRREVSDSWVSSLSITRCGLPSTLNHLFKAVLIIPFSLQEDVSKTPVSLSSTLHRLPL